MLSGFCSAHFGILFCSVLLGCQYTPLILLDRIVSGATFLTGGVLECDLAHRRTVSVLCTLHKIRCNPMHPLYGALPEPYVLVWVTRGAVIAHRYTYAPPRCRTSQCRRTCIALSVSLWNNLDALYSLVLTVRFQTQGQCLFIGLAARSLSVSY